MTLSSNNSSATLDGNGTTTSFPFDFVVWSTSQLRVYITGTDGLTDVTTNWTATLTETGGNVVYPAVGGTVLPTGASITILRDMPLTQTIELTSGVAFDPTVIETALDQITGSLQQINEEAERSVKVPPGSDVDPLDLLNTLTADAASAAASAATATTQAGIATTQAGMAATAKTNAEIAETNAETAETNAESAQTAAEAARDLSQTYSLNSFSYKQTASNAAISTAADRVQTGLDAIATAADVVSASGSASNANASAVSAAASAAKLTGTSTTSLAIAVASKSFTTQASKFFEAGRWLLITSDADPTNYMHGQVTSYSGTSLVVNVTNIGGSGTHADWTITVSGTRGAAGASSPASGLLSATTTVDVSAATAPAAGQVLTATASNAATWQTPTAGGYKTIFIGGGAMTPSQTTGATPAIVEDGTNDLTRPVMSFKGITADTSSEWCHAMPEDWNRGTVKAKVMWTGAAGCSASDTLRFSLAAGAFSDDDALDAALGTAVTMDDTVTAAGDMQTTPASAALTIGGTPALGDFIRWKITRDYDYGGQPMTEDAQVLGVWIQYQATKTPAAW